MWNCIIILLGIINIVVGQDITVTLFYDGGCASPFGSFELNADVCTFLPSGIGYYLWASQIHPWYNNMVCEYYPDNYCGGSTAQTFRTYEGSLENVNFCINPGLFNMPTYGFQSFYCWYDDIETTNGAKKRSITDGRPAIKTYYEINVTDSSLFMKDTKPSSESTQIEQYIQKTKGSNIPANLYSNATNIDVKTSGIGRRQIENNNQYVGSTRNGAFGVVATAYNLYQFTTAVQTYFPGGASYMVGKEFFNMFVDYIFDDNQSTYFTAGEYVTAIANTAESNGVTFGMFIKALVDMDFNNVPYTALSSVATDLTVACIDNGWQGGMVTLTGSGFTFLLQVAALPPGYNPA
jgi:hypothetical protein